MIFFFFFSSVVEEWGRDVRIPYPPKTHLFISVDPPKKPRTHQLLPQFSSKHHPVVLVFFKKKSFRVYIYTYIGYERGVRAYTESHEY